MIFLQNTLEVMWNQFYILNNLKYGLLNKGYVYKDIQYLYGQIDLANKLIDQESFIVLNELLRKTYFRLLKRIDKGQDVIIKIINNPTEWVLTPIEKYKEAWIEDEVLIFTTENKCGVFSKNKAEGYKYFDNKWQ